MKTVKQIIVTAAAVLAASAGVAHAQTPAAAGQAASTPQPSAPAVDAAPVRDGLGDLEAMTFGCPRAGLNAAAREAAKVPSQGTYQFSYFKVINDSHHASYEVQFKSNYEGEADLKYCVALYCQQGWDPKTTKTEVMLMGSGRQPAGTASHAAACGVTAAPVNRRPKR